MVLVALGAHDAHAQNCIQNPCQSGCSTRCNLAVCPETASCDPNCGGNPCGIQCACWDACSSTVCNPLCPQFNACSPNCVDPHCTPGCPGGSLCNDGCVDECNPIICPGSYCDTGCRPAANCDPLCGGNPCNPGCPLACGCPGSNCFNIEIDYMVDAGHSHKPNQAEIDAVKQMFACQGYTLNVEISDALPHYNALVRDPTCLIFFEYAAENSSFGRLKLDYYDHMGQPGWHYAIFAHDYEGANCQVTGSSGLAENPGNDLVVTLGQFTGNVGTAFDRASTLAHEFGHNLGLTHCGNNDPGGLFEGSCLNVGNFVPNVASIMDYFYQLSGVRSNMLCQGLSFAEAALFKEMDYSHGTMCQLNESALDEPFGSGMMSVDWDCGGTISGLRSRDLSGSSNGWCGANGGLQVLNDYDEWGAIAANYVVASDSDYVNMPTVECITASEVRQRIVAGGCTPSQPTLSTEACINADMFYLHPAGGGGADGTCSVPFGNIQQAHDAAANGSVLFFRAGDYSPPGPVLLTKPIKLFSTPTTTNATTVIQPP
ncbi:MAG: hypothetical protein AABZ12_14915 [Planctomycetota bacterium]